MIPKEAWPVVLEIRKLAPKPEELPIPKCPGEGAEEPCLGWDRGFITDPKCPLGFLPYARQGRPWDVDDFWKGCPFTSDQAREFWVWWDRQHDAALAVEEVWEKPLGEETPVQ